MATDTLGALRQTIAQILLTDTHEHLGNEENRIAQRAGLYQLFAHYASSDLVSAGMPAKDMARLREGGLSPQEEWELLEPYWLKARNTTYCRALDIAIRDIYGLPGLGRETYAEVVKRMEQAQKPGFYREVLKEKANIEISIVARWDPGIDRSLFAQSVNLDEFAMASTRHSLRAISEKCGVGIYSLADLVSSLDITFNRFVTDGAVAIKIGLAYGRPIFFDAVTEHEAESVFNNAFREHGEGLAWRDCKPLQDYMVHQMIRRAEAHNLVVQIHTGIQEGNGNYVTDSDPTLLTNVFMMYPNVRFDVFHAGFPYSRELGVLAKNFQNVYPDMCWMHIIGAKSARELLDEWLDLVPANKILGFGGDYGFVEGVYGHACIARENVARVLADRVERGDQTMEEAAQIAEMVLRTNARELFGLGA